jgi:hypothetical protein
MRDFYFALRQSSAPLNTTFPPSPVDDMGGLGGDGIFQSSVMFIQLGLQLNSEMSMRIYSEAGIAKNPLLAAVLIC